MNGGAPHDDAHDRWLVSYADFMTLLFALFVVMYAATRAGDNEIAEVVTTLRSTFELDEAGLAAPGTTEEALTTAVAAEHDPQATTAERAQASIDSAVQALEERFAGLDGIELPEVSVDENWIEINVSSSVLFDAGAVTLSDEAQTIVADVAGFLAPFPNPVVVEGYTDSLPSTSARFPSNWELSAFRASLVARVLEANGISGKRLSAVGYGENHPKETNATPEGRDANRRVNIVVARHADASPRTPYGSSFVHVRRDAPPSLDNVVERRTADGGLLFTAEPDGTPEDGTNP